MRSPRGAVVGHWDFHLSSRGALRAVIGLIHARGGQATRSLGYKKTQAFGERTWLPAGRDGVDRRVDV